MNWWLDFRRGPAFDNLRWVVLDVESSGLDAERDRLLAIAGMAVRLSVQSRLRIDLGDSFEVVLRQNEPMLDKANILLHGIGLGAQRGGMEPRVALEAFARWVGNSPLIAFHSAFDETMIRRARRTETLPRLRNPWVDLAQVAEAVRPDVRAKALDEWLAIFGIEVALRHQASADALGTAELLLRLWPAVVAQRAPQGFRGLLELAAQRRWLKGTE